MECCMIIQVAVTQSNFKTIKKPFTIFKQAYQLNETKLVLKFFPDITLWLKALYFEELLNWNKIEWMASKRLSSCNFHQYKSIGKDYFWYLVMPTG